MADLQRPVGFVNFDDIRGQNNEIELRIPYDDIERLQRGQYVLIGNENTPYLGRVISGPFYTPDAVSKESAFARTSILMANEVPFLPDFHAVCRVELLGRVNLENTTLSGFASRPFPKTPVHAMPADKIAELLQLEGNMYMGHLTGYEQIRVKLNAHEKKVLPRNLGVFGTVGSGKTNTAQVLIEEIVAAGWAVIVLDVEGEYISMDKPNEEARKRKQLGNAMRRFDVSPKGVETIQVFHCPGTESKRPDAREFCLDFSRLSPYALIEIMGLNEAQETRFLELFEDAEDKIKRQTGQSKPDKWSRFKDETNGGLKSLPGLTLDFLMKELNQILDKAESAYGNKASWTKVKQLLEKIQRYQIFNSVDYVLDVDDLVKPGQLSVFDLSDATNVRVNNIVIAQILHEIFEKKISEPEAPPTLVVIEEAHTFVSRDNVKAMESIVDMLREISRRGRKRWLGLCFISQQPAHLPNEIYELCNTKIVHQTTGKRNLDALHVSAGSVNEAVWGEVPLLSQGQALIISPQFSHPVLCDMRPCSSHREHTD